MSQSAATKAVDARRQRLRYVRGLIRHGTRETLARVPRWYRLQLLRSRGPKPKPRLDTAGDARHLRILPALKAVALLIAMLLCAAPATASPATVTCGRHSDTGTLVAKGNGRGLVLTTARVLADRSQVFVRLTDQRLYQANVLATEPQLGAAMLEIAEPPADPQRAVQPCSLRQGCPLLQRFVDRFRPRCAGGVCQPQTTFAQPTFAQPTFTQPATPWRPTGPPVDNRTPVRPDGTPANQPAQTAVDVGPAAWMAERATLEQNHQAAMRAKAAELDRLQQTLAAERNHTERALAQLAAQKATTCAGARTDGPPSLGRGPAVRAPQDPPAAAGAAETETAGGGWLELAGEAARSVLIGLGLPGGAAAVGLWVLGRWFKKRQRETPPADTARPETARADTAGPRPAAVASGPPSTQHHNVFSYVPTDVYDRAWSRAVQQLSEKYPGYAKVLEHLVRAKDHALKGETIDGAKP